MLCTTYSGGVSPLFMKNFLSFHSKALLTQVKPHPGSEHFLYEAKSHDWNPLGCLRICPHIINSVRITKGLSCLINDIFLLCNSCSV